MHDTINAATLAAQFINLTSRPVFLTGKAGTGKTTFLKSIITQTHKRCVIVAPTGIAAIQAGGTTIHSLFQIPLGLFLPENPSPDTALSDQALNYPANMLRHLHMNGRKKRVFMDLELLIIDEVSMLRADLLDAIDFVLRYVRKSEKAFGGVQLLLIGDLFQLPPVVKNQEWNYLQRYYPSIYFFEAWALKSNPLVYLELDKIYRQEDPAFINLLNNFRNNQVSQADLDLLSPCYKPDFKPNLEDKYITLTTHNAKADEINAECLAQLDVPSKSYKAQIEGDFPESAYPVEKQLNLKIGAQVMFVKNDITGEQRYFNGKIAEVTALYTDAVWVRTSAKETPFAVDLYQWKNIRYTSDKMSNEPIEEVLGTFSQFPLKLAWAITVHKSQGLTFEKAILDLGQVFAPGQAYVALSRMRSLKGLVLSSPIQSRNLRLDPHVGYFSKTQAQQEAPQSQFERDRLNFLFQYLEQCFSFQNLFEATKLQLLNNHKGENRLLKQLHAVWLKTIEAEVQQLSQDGQKFIRQLQKPFADPKQLNPQWLLERLAAANQYFGPKITKQLQTLWEKLQELQETKALKDFIAELFQLEGHFYEQFKQIHKAENLAKAILLNAHMQKIDWSGVDFHEQRKTALHKIFGENLTLLDEVNSEESKNRKGSFGKGKKASKAPKVPKEDTKMVSYVYLKDGFTVAEVAKKRKLTTTTIEGHLTYFIAKGDLKASNYLEPKKLNHILKTIVEMKSIKLQELKDRLGASYSYSDIKIAVAAHISDPQIF
ncbi:MAG: helicase [Pedobacter sp.]|nr:MAG: helicase [Pedobacter sp.]